MITGSKNYEGFGYSNGVESALNDTSYAKNDVVQIYNAGDIQRIQNGIPTGLEQGYMQNTFSQTEDKNLASYLKIFDWQDIFESSSLSTAQQASASTVSGYSSSDTQYWQQYEKNKNLFLIAGAIVISLIIFKKGRK